MHLYAPHPSSNDEKGVKSVGTPLPWILKLIIASISLFQIILKPQSLSKYMFPNVCILYSNIINFLSHHYCLSLHSLFPLQFIIPNIFVSCAVHSKEIMACLKQKPKFQLAFPNIHFMSNAIELLRKVNNLILLPIYTHTDR